MANGILGEFLKVAAHVFELALDDPPETKMPFSPRAIGFLLLRYVQTAEGQRNQSA
ncbi:hypothetical protein AB4Z48_29030 [Cupriavidus sp. 2TAF22]|uniref:hypothetical protein n=1 Tax=unclassified Cupriavidus TaxID=2640874 RepID=UPI003F8DFC21